ncbi:uncharacterized protein LOC118690841 [Molothrus ater]|uniref:uncharacterized protein LOC118690841 n=1 Tax=Molothrus ater TaxID=84834 RepID=UPI001748FDC7|nr:uncharacterized protein LOC118690841 [Molothrus ater]XP_036245703.1 uncharacterized protein LOC118690841 [Molothrus ater]XP_036245712.1 uncharacterized protein LOC118690841 [Molothrus ater]
MDPMTIITLLTVLLIETLPPPANPWIVPQPKANVWRTLAQAMGQEHICLDLGSAEDPMSSCLVGIPLPPFEFPYPFNVTYNPPLMVDAQNAWRDGLRKLTPLQSDPPELHLVGSARASACIWFQYSPLFGSSRYSFIGPPSPEYQAAQWCNFTIRLPFASTSDTKPLALPRGTFFICGDRAWAGIPPRLAGGVCTFGKLTLLNPNVTQIRDWKYKRSQSKLAISKRDLRDFDPDCDSKIEHWAKPKSVALTLFLPWVSIAKSLGELGRLECWVAKQANFTSAALTDLLADEETTRKATLQNRAAIDFLLLLHHHSCEEFEGLCCLNLSSKAEDARVSIRKMKELVHEVKSETSDWLGNLFKGWGLSGWAGSIVRSVLYFVLVIFIIVIACSLMWGLVKRLLLNASAANINHLELSDVEEDPASTSDSESMSGGSLDFKTAQETTAA